MFTATDVPTHAVRAAVVAAQGSDFTWEDLQLEGPRADEVLVRMVATGLCHTDLTLRSFMPAEMFPRVFGHEGAGVVEEVGAEVSGLAVGDHVVLSFRSCRSCAICEQGDYAYCADGLPLNYMGYRMDGSTVLARQNDDPVQGSFFGQSSLASHVIAYADNCVVVDPELDLSLLAPFGCGYQTGAGAVLNILQPSAADRIAVYGAGAVGLAAIAAARASEVAALVAVDVLPGRLEAAAALGAHVIDASTLSSEEVVQQVRDLTGGGATGAIETTAIGAVVRQAAQALAPRGHLVAIGLGSDDWPLDGADMLSGGKRLSSTVEGDADPLTFIPRLVAMRESGAFPLDHLVTRYPADQLARAVADVESGAVIKPVLVW